MSWAPGTSRPGLAPSSDDALIIWKVEKEPVRKSNQTTSAELSQKYHPVGERQQFRVLNDNNIDR